MNKLLGMLDEISSDPAAPRALRDLYDSEINYTDDYIRALVEALPDRERTLIIVTSDHGEEFLERGSLGHGSSLFEEQVRVPLIIVSPGDQPAAGEVVQPVSIVDIFPTVCAAAGVAPPPGLQGKSLLDLLAGGDADGDREILAEINQAQASRQQQSLRRGDWKFVRRNGEGERRALYDLKRDPEEKRNLVREETERAERMERELEAWREAHPPFPAPPADEPLGEREIQELRSLGYLN
jgi:arylsulfatase A-like enzyme